MSYYNRYYDKPRDPRADHEKSWNRTKALAWDDKWQGLSIPARRALPPRHQRADPGGIGHAAEHTPSTRSRRGVVEGADRGRVRGGSSRGTGKKSAKVVPNQAAPRLLCQAPGGAPVPTSSAPPDRQELTKSVKHAFTGQGEPTIQRVLTKADIPGYCRIEEGLESVRDHPALARSGRWSRASRSRPGRSTRRSSRPKGPVPLAKLPSLVEEASPQRHQEGPDRADQPPWPPSRTWTSSTFEIIVGLLPEVRDDDRRRGPGPASVRPWWSASIPRRSALSAGGLEVNDPPGSSLLELAGESPQAPAGRRESS